MNKFEGVLICTDLDGTLLKNDKTISSANSEAIEYFKSQGGLFTFVTGRMHYYIGDYLKLVKPNAPVGCANGGSLYDHINQKYIFKSILPKEITELVRFIDEKFSDVGIQVCTYEKTYFAKNNDATKKFRKLTGLKNHTCNYEDVTEPISKIIFCTNKAEEISQIKETLDNHKRADEFNFIRSSRSLYEILPKGISKGTSIKKLCKHLGIDQNKTIAIGDYNNDIPMFSAAKAGIAVKNACTDALNAADFITVSNEEDAIANVIYELEKGKYI